LKKDGGERILHIGSQFDGAEERPITVNGREVYLTDTSATGQQIKGAALLADVQIGRHDKLYCLSGNAFREVSDEQTVALDDEQRDFWLEDRRVVNPFSTTVVQMYTELNSLDWSGTGFLASAIQVPVYTFVLIVGLILWPYGLLATIQLVLWQLIVDTNRRFQTQRATASIGRDFAHALTLGVLFIIWFPFFVACVPLILLGNIVRSFVKH
jgi:hypothetical protein